MNNLARSRGLTLMELLVAMGVFTVVATLGYRGLQQTITAKQQLSQHSEQFARLQGAMLWLERDLTTLIARPARDYLGDRQPAFFSQGKGDQMRVEFTHSSRGNPAGLPQSDLQRVSYHQADDQLIRSYWPRLDAMVSTKPGTVPLFPGIDQLEWHFLDQQGAWHRQWPPINHRGNTQRVLPKAVQIRFTLPEFGRIERTLITGSGE